MKTANILGASLCLAAATPAFAQPAPEIDLGGDSITIAAGAGAIASYEGSDDYRIIPVAAVRGRIAGHNFFSQGAYLYFDLIPEGSGNNLDLALGPVAGLRLGRSGGIVDQRVEALGELDIGYEIGGFAGISKTGILTSPYDSLSFRLTYLADVGGAHQSHVITPSIHYGTPLSRRAYAALSLSADFAGQGYADYYYDISPAAAAASGLPAFDAEGGFKSWTGGLLLVHSITGDLLGGLSVFATGNYTRLQGDFARSPIVSVAGDRNQWFSAAGLAYTF